MDSASTGGEPLDLERLAASLRADAADLTTFFGPLAVKQEPPPVHSEQSHMDFTVSADKPVTLTRRAGRVLHTTPVLG
jgi:hypothetical protein